MENLVKKLLGLTNPKKGFSASSLVSSTASKPSTHSIVTIPFPYKILINGKIYGYQIFEDDVDICCDEDKYPCDGYLCNLELYKKLLTRTEQVAYLLLTWYTGRLLEVAKEELLGDLYNFSEAEFDAAVEMIKNGKANNIKKLEIRRNWK